MSFPYSPELNIVMVERMLAYYGSLYEKVLGINPRLMACLDGLIRGKDTRKDIRTGGCVCDYDNTNVEYGLQFTDDKGATRYPCARWTMLGDYATTSSHIVISLKWIRNSLFGAGSFEEISMRLDMEGVK
jgi:hypothetical protein